MTGALVLLTNRNGQILLQHKDSGAPTYPNKWCLFGGGIEKGETAQTALKREFHEELEWDFDDFEHFRTYQANDVFYAQTTRTVEDLRPHLREGDDLGFFSKEQIESLTIAEPHRKIINDYFANQKSLVVHFICRGNAFRSIIAQAYLRSLAIPGIEVISSGTVATIHQEQNTTRYQEIVNLLEKQGLKQFIKPAHGEQLTQELLDRSDVIICMNQNVFEGCLDSFKLPQEVIYWNIIDIDEPGRIPKNHQDVLAFEEAAFAEITQLVDELVKNSLNS